MLRLTFLRPPPLLISSFLAFNNEDNNSINVSKVNHWDTWQLHPQETGFNKIINKKKSTHNLNFTISSTKSNNK